MSSIFDTSRLALRPLEERRHSLSLKAILPLQPVDHIQEGLDSAARHIIRARDRGSAVIMMIGAHVLRSGVQRYLIDLMERGYLSCIAMNGACLVHDFEFALIGQTTESVARYINTGQFGLWEETGRINEIVKTAAREGHGLGTEAGKAIETGDFPHKAVSMFAAGYRLGIPVTVHVGIGYDIVYEHPNCDGAAWGSASYVDFLRFVRVMESLEGGVIMDFGSAVMAPEIFLKALAMVRNVAIQEGRRIGDFTTLVCDLFPIPEDFSKEAPEGCHEYYFRPWKTMLVRAVADGGKSFYVRGAHRKTVPALWTAVKERDKPK